MQNKKYCNTNFNSIGYPVLKKVDKTRPLSEQLKQETQKNNRNRFYADPININGTDYLICNEWYKDKHEKHLLRWIEYNKI